ncbi:Imm1 family immunity protein [Glycomyces sp. NPDC048151]|uniref:Imm1 family immunity protein n=1 Tax=Glycomyces sp. NPDC048151 TaxID=3364002 RepID=UPI00372336DD
MSRIDAAFVIHYDTSYEPVADASDLTSLLDDDATMTNPQGTHGMAYWLGVRDSDDEDHPMREPVLRVDLDPETGAGALRWLADDLIGIEEGYTPRVVTVCESSAQPLAWVPVSVARVSYETARAAAVRYIETGRLPDNVSWSEPSQG